MRLFARTLFAALPAALIAATPASAQEGTYAARTIHRQGYLVPHQARYERAKRNAAARAELAPRVPRPAGPAVVASSFDGLRDNRATPPDTTGAIGTSRYIELVNSKFEIFKRNGRRVATGGMRNFIGAPRKAGLTDPQVIWDPGTNRFYYAEVESPDPRHNFIAVGFSKTATPGGARGFCHYRIPFGADFPDFPKLGDTADFVLVGVNAFAGRFYAGADVAWARKPPPGTGCPRSLVTGKQTALRTASGGRAFTPVPANQIDTSSQGWIVATHNSFGTQHSVTVFSVTPDANGRAVIQRTGVDVPVPSFDFPTNARQRGSSQVLDTADGRLSQAVLATDPSLPGAPTAIWTQHTVAGGGGSKVAWYEINPAAASLLQSGQVLNPGGWAFNAAISPDRAVNAGVGSYGGDMAVVYDTTSRHTLPAVQVVSKLAGGVQSAPTLVKSSRVALTRSCNGTCRWGDYSGATPDPTPPLGSPQVWAASQWQGGINQFAWRTVNFVVTP